MDISIFYIYHQLKTQVLCVFIYMYFYLCVKMFISANSVLSISIRLSLGQDKEKKLHDWSFNLF